MRLFPRRREERLPVNVGIDGAVRSRSMPGLNLIEFVLHEAVVLVAVRVVVCEDLRTSE